MYKKHYDQKKIALRAVILVYNNYPDLDDVTKRQMAESTEWLEIARKSFVLEELSDKIYKCNFGIITKLQSQSEANRIINNMPQELWPNVEEWIDDQPISDIPVHGVSIPQIINRFSDERILFLDAIECLCRWKSIGYKGENFYELYFMRM
jgi:hypothetical protein